MQLFQTGGLGIFLFGRFYIPIVQEQVESFKRGVASGLDQKKRMNIIRSFP
ncbi:MAG: hypothetical protein PHD91_03785 [bacterium]|nr:hypothetical protein [bacterium]MDD4557812.1 hypothetical protein [bacterium]